MAPPADISLPSWSDLVPDLLGLVLIHLPLPTDRARFRAVCRAWHSAARHHARQLPWIVSPDGSFGTIGHDNCGGFDFQAGTIPGMPENVTCLGAAAVGWLALDCTDDVFRRTYHWDKFVGNEFLQPRRDVKHRHNYRLYNPFINKTVLLPELDSVIGEVAETFDIRKVLMRHSSLDRPDDDQLVVIITNSYYYNIIICRPGKGSCVLPNIDVFDVAFLGDRLYGITPEDELVALELAEDDNGAPIVTKCRRVIKKQLAEGEEDDRSWMYNDDDDGDDETSRHNGKDKDGDAEDDDNEDDDDDDGDDDDDDDETSRHNGKDENYNGDGLVPSGKDMMHLENGEWPYDSVFTTRQLVVQSCGDGGEGELLMVRHHSRSSASIGIVYTVDVDILKADMEAGNWVPMSKLVEGEALFLSQSFSKSIHAYGDIMEGFIYYTEVDDLFDTKSRERRLISFPGRWQGADHKLLTWLFPPELQL